MEYLVKCKGGKGYIMKILLAEDDFVTRKFMTNFLSKYGECDVTVDGMEAVDAFMMALEDDAPYDLVCLDIMMPVMDGYQALMGIRNLEKERNIPPEKAVKIIMTTALNEEKNVKMVDIETESSDKAGTTAATVTLRVPNQKMMSMITYMINAVEGVIHAEEI